MAIKFDTFKVGSGGAGTDTLDDVTGRGATTTNSITVGGVTVGTEYSLPATDGTASGQVLTTDALGTLSFTTLDFTGGLEYKGSFNANAGTPDISNAEKGDFYVIDTAGTIYGQTWAVGDHLLINEDMGGTITNSKIDKIDNTDSVTSVNTQTGAVVLSANDLAADHTATNYTAANANIDGHLSGIDTKFGTLGTASTKNTGTAIGDVVLLEDIGGSVAGLPAIDGSQLTGLPSAPVTSVNTLTGAVVVSGDDIAADHTATNYTATNANVDGHLSGIDTALGTVASPTLDDVTTNGATTTNAINVGTITTSGDILADTDATRTIGAEATRFITAHTDINGAIRFKAKNNQGSTINKGQAVYISGISGTVPEVKLAQANSALTMPAFGLALANANDLAEVQIVTFGNLTDYNTTTYSLSLGDTVYVSETTAGALTSTAPTGEANLIQNIGRVLRADASAGIIKVGGAGRSNATPNLNQDKIFLGNASNQAVSTALSSIALSSFNDDLTYPVTSVNTLTGAVVVSGDDIAADHTASNYTAANANVDGHLSGIDTKFGTLGTASTKNTGTAIGDVVLLEDIGGSVAGLPAVDGSQLTGLPSAPVTSVNTLTGAVVVSGDDIAADHTATNYTATNANVDGHLSGIDTALGSVSGSAPTVTTPASLTTDYTISTTSGIREIFAFTSSADRAITLPTASTVGEGYQYDIKSLSAVTFTITCAGSDTIDDGSSTTFALSDQYASITLVADADNNRWFIV
jgi:hypothetical protein